MVKVMYAYFDGFQQCDASSASDIDQAALRLARLSHVTQRRRTERETTGAPETTPEPQPATIHSHVNETLRPNLQTSVNF